MGSNYYSAEAQHVRDTRTAERAERIAKSPAISIIRVSGDGQDESSQRGSCQRAADREGLTLVREIPLHAVSGFKGSPRHLAAMADALNAVRTGEVAAIVVAHSSRAARLPHRDVIRWQWDVEEAGGRLVSDDEASWARGTTPMDDAWSLMTAGENHKKSVDIGMHVSRAFRDYDLANAFRGAVPAGYTVEGDKRSKRLVHAPEGLTRRVRTAEKGKPRTARLPSAEEVRQAFIDAAGDFSTTTLAARLDMTPDAIAKMLRHEVYSTGMYPVKRADGTVYFHRCEPIVTISQQRAAIEGMARRRTGDNVTSRGLAKDDMSGALFCGACDDHGAMHRYFGGGKKRADGSSTDRVRRYRCDACGRSVRADDADQAVVKAMRVLDAVPVVVTRVIDSSSTARDDLERVLLELSGINTRGLDDEAEDAERRRLREERDRLRPLAEAAGERRTVSELLRDEHGNVVTHGQRWRNSDGAGRRAYLTRELRVLVQAAGDRSGKVTATVSGQVSVSA